MYKTRERIWREDYKVGVRIELYSSGDCWRKGFLLNAVIVLAGPASSLAGWQPIRASKHSKRLGFASSASKRS